MKKDQWFPLGYNKKNIYVLVSNKDQPFQTDFKSRKYKIYVKPADLLTSKETKYLVDYLILEGFLE